MKRSIYSFVAAAVLLAGMASCDKAETTPTVPTTPTNPTTPTATTPTPPTPAPTGNNLSGALISLKMNYTTQYTGMPQPVSVETQMGLALFYDSPGSSTKADAGTVTVNTHALEKKQDNSYFKMATTGTTPASLGFSGSSDWNVSGSGAVAAFSYNDDAAFPNYSGTVPTSVTKADGVTLTFNSSSLTGADSVYVLIASGSNSVMRAYHKNAGTVTISATDLQGLANVTDNTALFEICPFRYREVVKNGKNYFFIKEQAIVRSININ